MRRRASAITSCRIYSCPRFMTVGRARLAGTWSRYSKKAIDQLANTAMSHGFADRCFRWPYQANVMNTLLHIKSVIVKTCVLKTGALATGSDADCRQSPLPLHPPASNDGLYARADTLSR